MFEFAVMLVLGQYCSIYTELALYSKAHGILAFLAFQGNITDCKYVQEMQGNFGKTLLMMDFFFFFGSSLPVKELLSILYKEHAGIMEF